MIAILGQTEDDILYYCSRFTNGETIVGRDDLGR